MKERPILFSGAMVRAILSGAKTQTRRIAPIQSLDISEHDGGLVTWNVRFTKPIGKSRTIGSYSGGFVTPDKAQRIIAAEFCPYGQPGDRLYVRETWQPIFEEDAGFCGVRYASGGCPEEDKRAGSYLDGTNRWRPSIHMPRWASRLTLEITGVRVERLQAISEADAIAEGVTAVSSGGVTLFTTTGVNCFQTAKDAYAALWESINGPGSWDANPWVWVVEFRRIER